MEQIQMQNVDIQILRCKIKLNIKKKKYTQTIKFIKCDLERWPKNKVSLSKSFQNFNIGQYLCPQYDKKIQLQGKYTSQTFQYLKLAVKRCDPLNLQNIQCVSDQQYARKVNQKDTLGFNLYFVNTLVNPDQLIYTNQYSQDRIYITFNAKIGTTADIFIDQYDIQTDQSLMPRAQIRSQKLWLVPELPRYISRVSDLRELLTFFFRKSARNIKIQRWYLKIDQSLSFIGGLFSSLCIGLVIFTFYSNFAYNIDICYFLFSEDDNWLKKNRLDFLQFIGLCIFRIVKFFKKNFSWLRMQKYNERIRQCNKQMDIVLLIRKILFLQKAVQFLFKNEQFYGLHLQNDMSIQQAEQSRKRYKFFKKIKDYCHQDEYDKNDYQTNNMQDDEKIDWRFLSNKLTSSSQIDDKKKKVKKLSKQKMEKKVENKNEIMIQRLKQKDNFLGVLSGALFKNLMKNKQNKDQTIDKKEKTIHKIQEPRSTRIFPVSERGLLSSGNDNNLISSGKQIQLNDNLNYREKDNNNKNNDKNNKNFDNNNKNSDNHSKNKENNFENQIFNVITAKLQTSLEKNHKNTEQQNELQQEIDIILGNVNQEKNFDKQFQQMITNEDISENLKNQMRFLHKGCNQDEISKKIWSDMSSQVKIMLSISSKNMNKINSSKNNNKYGSAHKTEKNISNPMAVYTGRPKDRQKVFQDRLLIKNSKFKNTNSKIIPTGSQQQLKDQQRSNGTGGGKIAPIIDIDMNNYDQLNFAYIDKSINNDEMQVSKKNVKILSKNQKQDRINNKT